jgi:DNA-binding transcriptional LysR family regulator
MDSISRVAIFVQVARLQSFVAAGRELGMSGPAVSKQIQALEDRLGVRLLNRTTRSVTLTDEGALYLDRAAKALEDLQEAERQIQELKDCPTGKLKINAPMSFGNQYLVGPIAQFAKRYPEVKVEVDFDDRWVDVIAEGYDVVVRIGVLDDSSLIARKLASCPIILCASPAYKDQHGLPNEPSQLPEFPAIIYSKHSQSGEWRYQTPDGSRGSVRLNRNFAGNSAEMQLEACLQGLGIALLPVFIASEHLDSGDLIRVLPAFETYPQRGIYALFPQKRYLATRVRLFVDWLSECGEEFPWQ